MAVDPYASCPCGSGKKFKWCCQPLHAEIERAFQQDADGQHELALRLMDEVIAAHPNHPEPYGRKAQLLHQNQRPEDAEAALEQAFAINPKYAFGYLLKGMFRYQEGEIRGALMLFRKAADNYDPQATDLIAQVEEYIAECEMRLNRPVAATAAMRHALVLRPTDAELREHFDHLLGPESHLPEAARKEYRFQAPVPATDGPLHLSEAVKLLEGQAQAEGAPPTAWYNLGLARAWLGDNAAALEALDRYVSLETDEGKAADAWTLAEVLRHGAGLESQADVVDHSVAYQIRDGRSVSVLLEEWQAAGRLLVIHHDPQQNLLQALVLDSPPVISTAAGPPDALPFGAYLLILQDLVRLSSPVRDRLDRVRGELERKASGGVSPGNERLGPASFADTMSEAALFPLRISDPDEAKRRVRAHAEQFFEGVWLQRPLKTLGGVPPIDAAGHAVLKKKLRGVVQFLEQCARVRTLGDYDFNRLRRKLGLGDGATASTDAATADVTALGASELAALSPEALSDEQLEQAWQTAQRLDAHELGRRFAQALTHRPPQADRTDRYPYYSYLIQRAVADGNLDAALDAVNEGEKADCEQNEGRRRNEYELRRAQVHARRGEPDAAHDVFDRLIQRDPTNTRTRAAAAEAMLALKQGARALRFAEEGLVEARKQKDRDAEGHLMELVAAAKKQTG